MKQSYSCNVKQADVLGISIHLFKDIDEALNLILPIKGDSLIGNAIAINPEKVIKSLECQHTNNTLRQSTINYADGIGVVKTLVKKTGLKLNRVPGVELWQSLMVRAGQLQTPVFLIGATDDVLSRTIEKLSCDYGTNIVGYHNGFFDEKYEQDLFETIANTKAKIVCVAMGSPKQELLIERCKAYYPNAFYMGVGGSFDVFSGKVKRAPKLFRQCNLEWLYRLMKQPTRLFRQVNLAKYLWLDLTNKL